MMIRWKRWVRGDVENVDVRILRRLARVARDLTEHYHKTGGFKNARFSVFVNSGHRTYAEQEALYRQNMNPRTGKPWPGRPLTARPGTSNHGKSPSPAADINLITPNGVRTSISRVRLRKYGLKAPVAGEFWHIELA